MALEHLFCARKVKPPKSVMFIKKNFRTYNIFSLETLVKNY